MEKLNYAQLRTPIKHDFFGSENHFINYCIRLCRDNGIKDDRINLTTFSLFSWTLVNEDKFYKSGVYPPYRKLTWELKQPDSKITVPLLFDEYIEELTLLKEGKVSIFDCINVSSHGITNGSVPQDLPPSNKSDEFTALLEGLEKKSGVYRLFDKDKLLLYIGKSYDLYSRIKTSLKDKGARYISILQTNNLSDASILEMFLIAKHKPPLNKESNTLDLPTVKVSYKYKFTPLIQIYR